MASNTEKLENILLLFYRPLEPVFMPKGRDKKVFRVPHKFLDDKYKLMGNISSFAISSKEVVPVKEDITLPDLEDIPTLGRHDKFSVFFPKHRLLADKLINIFMKAKDLDELLSVIVYVRDRINPLLFNYGLSVALLHREETKKGVKLPSMLQTFPGKFVNNSIFLKAKEESVLFQENSTKPIDIPFNYTATNVEEEHRIAYFREDIGVNLHHWHWHLAYPHSGDYSIVNKDRRGELFYYMHHQIMARYNCERLCNNLSRVKSFNEWREGMHEAYFPKLDHLMTSSLWPSRVKNQKLSDLRRKEEDIWLDVEQLIQWRERIFTAINLGYAIDDNGHRIPLTDDKGIDILGNMVESSQLSVNSSFYGDMHNMGHVFISYVHDPDHRQMESNGVMGDNTTAMRDPIFYRWHAFIDDVFEELKATLPRYTVDKLTFPGVKVTDVLISTPNAKVNTLQTTWKASVVDLSHGLDFESDKAVNVKFTHLHHEEFTYKITVMNEDSVDRQRQGTCRIFLAPRYNEWGKEWLFSEQRKFFIEMDRFVVTLTKGINHIERKSSDSSVTIPYHQIFRPKYDTPDFKFCGCGWPQYMLVPKGTTEGFECQLFVMISDYDLDKVNAHDEDIMCRDASSYCGIKDSMYPDRQPMGYPFDRMAHSGVRRLNDFLTPNMKVQNCFIMFTDDVKKSED